MGTGGGAGSGVMDQDTLGEVSENLLARILTWIGNLEPSDRQILALFAVALVLFAATSLIRARMAYRKYKDRKDSEA